MYGTCELGKGPATGTVLSLSDLTPVEVCLSALSLGPAPWAYTLCPLWEAGSPGVGWAGVGNSKRLHS